MASERRTRRSRRRGAAVGLGEFSTTEEKTELMKYEFGQHQRTTTPRYEQWLPYDNVETYKFLFNLSELESVVLDDKPAQLTQRFEHVQSLLVLVSALIEDADVRSRFKCGGTWTIGHRRMNTVMYPLVLSLSGLCECAVSYSSDVESTRFDLLERTKIMTTFSSVLACISHFNDVILPEIKEKVFLSVMARELSVIEKKTEFVRAYIFYNAAMSTNPLSSPDIEFSYSRIEHERFNADTRYKVELARQYLMAAAGVLTNASHEITKGVFNVWSDHKHFPSTSHLEEPVTEDEEQSMPKRAQHWTYQVFAVLCKLSAILFWASKKTAPACSLARLAQANSVPIKHSHAWELKQQSYGNEPVTTDATVISLLFKNNPHKEKTEVLQGNTRLRTKIIELSESLQFRVVCE